MGFQIKDLETMSTKGCQIFVTKLPRDSTREDLRDLFRKYGKIREISIKRGYAFVEYYDHHDANDAIEGQNGAKWEGNRLVVEKAGERKTKRNETRGPQPADRCFNCGERGHWANECNRKPSCRGRRSLFIRSQII